MAELEVQDHGETQPNHGLQAFLLIGAHQSPLRLKAEIEARWTEIAERNVCCLWSAALYAPQSVGMYVTAPSRRHIEMTSEALRSASGSAQVEIRLCKQDQHISTVSIDVQANISGLVSISLTPESQTKEIEVLSILRGFSGLRLARACYGSSDILALINTSTLDDFRDIIVGKIRDLHAVATTSTNLAYELDYADI